MTGLRRMTPRLTCLLVLLSGAGLSGCGPPNAESAAVDAWMLCDECRTGQRAAVAALGDDVVPSLATRLRGPPIRRYEAMRRKFAESFQPGLGLSEEAYLAMMLDGYVALYQTRAAVSLGDIGTTSARRELRKALDDAAVAGYRPDVLRAIQRSLVATVVPGFLGTISDSVVEFGDTIVVRPDPGLAWDGNESVVLIGSPFGRQLVTARFDAPLFDDSLEFVAIGDVGEYMLAVRYVGPSDVTQAGRTIRIAALNYQTHSALTAPTITGSPFPQMHYLALEPPGDSVDWFRFEPAAATTLTIQARWPGLDAVVLGWRTCAMTAPAGSAVSGEVVDELMAPLSNASVSVVGTPLSAMTDSNGTFPLMGIPAIAAPGGVARLLVSRAGFRPVDLAVPVSTIGLRIGMVSASATRATAMNLSGMTVPIPGGACRLLSLTASQGGKPRIIQLRVF